METDVGRPEMAVKAFRHALGPSGFAWKYTAGPFPIFKILRAVKCDAWAGTEKIVGVPFFSHHRIMNAHLFCVTDERSRRHQSGSQPTHSLMKWWMHRTSEIVQIETVGTACARVFVDLSSLEEKSLGALILPRTLLIQPCKRPNPLRFIRLLILMEIVKSPSRFCEKNSVCNGTDGPGSGQPCVPGQ